MTNKIQHLQSYKYAALHLKSNPSITKAYSVIVNNNVFNKNKKINKSIISNQTDICIDGPYRCANHFMLEAMSTVYPKLNIAHHYHSPGSIKLALRYNLPCIFVLRKPIDQIASTKIFLPNLSIDFIIYESLSFYRSLKEYQNDIICSDFKRSINNINSIVNELHSRFLIEPKIKNYDLSIENYRNLVIDRKSSIVLDKSRSPIPSIERGIRKDLIKDQINFKLSNTKNGKSLEDIYKIFNELSLKSEDLYS